MSDHHGPKYALGISTLGATQIALISERGEAEAVRGGNRKVVQFARDARKAHVAEFAAVEDRARSMRKTIENEFKNARVVIPVDFVGDVRGAARDLKKQLMQEMEDSRMVG